MPNQGSGLENLFYVVGNEISDVFLSNFCLKNFGSKIFAKKSTFLNENFTFEIGNGHQNYRY